MSFPTVYYITQVIPPCYTAGYAMCVCVSFGACVYRSLGFNLASEHFQPDKFKHFTVHKMFSKSFPVNSIYNNLCKNFNCQKTMYFILYYLDIHLCTHAISTISAIAIKTYTYFILTHITHILCVYYFTIYTECHIVRSTHHYLATSKQYLCEHKGSLSGEGIYYCIIHPRVYSTNIDHG